MSIEWDDIENEIKKPPPCTVCGNYGYRFPVGQTSAKKCEACRGDKRSRNPRDYQR